MNTKYYLTSGISTAVENSSSFAKEISTAVDKYVAHDWGDTCDEDQELNNKALEDGSRIIAKYSTSKGNIFIITEADRSATTILFANEY